MNFFPIKTEQQTTNVNGKQYFADVNVNKKGTIFKLTKGLLHQQQTINDESTGYIDGTNTNIANNNNTNNNDIIMMTNTNSNNNFNDNSACDGGNLNSNTATSTKTARILVSKTKTKTGLPLLLKNSIN